MKKVEPFEPWIFIFFGIFHLHRIWALIDRAPYADFWLGVFIRKDCFYYILLGLLVILCILGIRTFLNNLHNNFWWRWVYFLGGSYLLFDLFAIATGLEFWKDILLKMFEVNAPYWNLIWGFFVLLGGSVFILGIKLLIERHRQK